MLAVSISIEQLYRTRQELISRAMRKARSWHRCSSRWDRLTAPHLGQARARPVLLTKYHHACKGLINKEKTWRAGRGRGASVRSRRLTMRAWSGSQSLTLWSGVVPRPGAMPAHRPSPWAGPRSTPSCSQSITMRAETGSQTITFQG